MTATTVTLQKHQGPPLPLLAVLYMALFIAGLSFVISFTTPDHWPNPGSAPQEIIPYFQTHHAQVAMCMFLQFSAIVCLGIFTATVVSRFWFLGVRAAGPWIALLGGLLTVADGFAATFVGWAMIYPSVAQNGPVLLGLYYLAYAFGGPGFSVPFGLLLAGIAIPAGLSRLIPRWLMWCGVALAVVGELSSLHLIVWSLLPLIPLTRFPGFLWLIAVAFKLPKTREPLKTVP
jgi:hypothetical protein